MKFPAILGLFALPALCLAAPSAARIDEIAAWLPEHPAADGARITDRAAWDALAATPYAKRLVDSAERRLGQPVPEAPDDQYLEFSQTGNRTHYQASVGQLLDGFMEIYVAECLENKGRFLAKVVDYVDAICALKSWTLPAHDASLTCFHGKPHVDLYAGHVALALAICRDWLADRLPPPTRAKIADEIARRIFAPHLDHARGVRKIHEHWWFHGGNNWNSVCNCCVVRTALAVVEDRRARAEFVAFAEESVPYALAGYTADGYCTEGMGYWTYGYGHHIFMGLSLRAATGGRLDLFADPKCRDIMKYAYGFQMQDGHSPHFADGSGNAGVVNLALGRQVWPDIFSSTALKVPLLRGDPAEFSLRAFGQEPAPAAPTMDTLPLRSWFPSAQVLIARANHPERKMCFGVAFKGGHNNELHNHNDIGSYYVMLDCTEMTGDPGGEVYTRRTFSKDRYVSPVLNSYGHPVPVVGGKLQLTGRQAAARILSTSFTDKEDSISIEYASAYPVKALASLVRTLTFNRETNALTVSDRIVCSEPTAFEVPVITYRTWKKNEASTHFSFDKSEKTHRKLEMSVSASAPVTFAEQKIENPSRPDVHRLAFTFAKPVTEATFTTVFTTH